MCMQKKRIFSSIRSSQNWFSTQNGKNCEVEEKPHHCSLILKMFGELYPDEHFTSAGRLSSCKLLQPEQEGVCQVPQESLS